MRIIKCRECGDAQKDTPENRVRLDEGGWECQECGGDVTLWPAWEGSAGLELICAERKRQIEVEGWTPKHDAEHSGGEIAWAAVCYAAPGRVFHERHVLRSIRFEDPWPWDQRWDKRRTTDSSIPMSTGERRRERIKELTKAGALIAAEIDRISALPEPTDPMAR